MIRNFTSIILLTVVFFCAELGAQDIHFTHFTSSPIQFNPALAGAFEGTLRASGNFRSQWNGSNIDGYTTYDPSIDAPIPFMIKDRHWIGAGIQMLNDKRGRHQLGLNQFKLGLAFHFSLDKKITSFISFGAQFISNSTSLTYLNDMFGDTPFQVRNGSNLNDPDVNTVTGMPNSTQDEDATTSFSDWAFGVNYIKRTKKGEFSIGLALAHPFTNNISFGSTQEDIPARISGMASYKGLLGKKYKIEPAILYQTMGAYGSELSANTMLGMKLKPELPYWIKAGLGVRTGTLSPQVLLGLDYNSLSATLAFDIPMNDVQDASGFQNAFELGLVYIWTRNKVPNPDPIIFCPRL